MTPSSDHLPSFHDASAPPARILVVDDQPANIQIVGGMLGRLGHEIVPASDGPTALKRVAIRRPDLILMDLIMPDMDGCEVCRQLRAHPEWGDIPVIFLSAADDKDLVVRALESGGVDYVTKPFHQAELTLRVRTQLALKTARDRLSRLAEDKDELVGILAHDLKSHLAGIEMSARLLQQRLERPGPPDARAAQLAENIARTGGALSAFVKEFLANSRADHGMEFIPTPVDLGATVTAVVDRYREIASRKQLVIELRIPAGDSTVLADPAALDQVVENLVSNAVKFSPPGRRIRVCVKPTPRQVECSIQDEGPGFTADDRERMFRRYRRLSARPTAGEPCTGLGLSIVQKHVGAMRGNLRLESAPETGAHFVVSLPRPMAA